MYIKDCTVVQDQGDINKFQQISPIFFFIRHKKSRVSFFLSQCSACTLNYCNEFVTPWAEIIINFPGSRINFVDEHDFLFFSFILWLFHSRRTLAKHLIKHISTQHYCYSCNSLSIHQLEEGQKCHGARGAFFFYFHLLKGKQKKSMRKGHPLLFIRNSNEVPSWHYYTNC